MTDSLLDHTVTQSDGRYVISLIGDSDFNTSRELLRWLTTAIDQAGGRYVVIDAGQLAAIDSSGLGILLRAYYYSQQRHVTICMVNTSGKIKRMLEVTGITELIAVG
ncbi:anti-anti-sigma factor [Allocatelliglobosispora scoriae]|uniref:Anti-sigma factor antagonist n=1 Tax=Allocatelliglobosispora scoriae TaxID=643052 RepID=A0A841BJQ1_9ACTN|nr:STAS domain-containing protein [Allocatelliglobosispora scoriae]MBB5867389.1 anti-anti-sigma factor [Allocatelliglobosispora scoriae]